MQRRNRPVIRWSVELPQNGSIRGWRIHVGQPDGAQAKVRLQLAGKLTPVIGRSWPRAAVPDARSRHLTGRQSLGCLQSIANDGDVPSHAPMSRSTSTLSPLSIITTYR